MATSVMLALPGSAGSRITNAKINEVEQGLFYLYIDGTGQQDRITIRKVPGIDDPNKFFYEIEDPAGIDVVPDASEAHSNCFRKDANTIHCPVEAVSHVVLKTDGGDDVLRNDTDLSVQAIGGAGADKLDGDGNDEFTGGAGNDKLIGQGGNDKLKGGPGRDRLAGGPGKDKLIGGPGNDRINCGSGNRDVGIGGPGRDLGANCEIVKH